MKSAQEHRSHSTAAVSLGQEWGGPLRQFMFQIDCFQLPCAEKLKGVCGREGIPVISVHQPR